MPVRFNIRAVQADPPDSAKIASLRFFFLCQTVLQSAAAEIEQRERGKWFIHPFQMLVPMAGEGTQPN